MVELFKQPLVRCLFEDGGHVCVYGTGRASWVGAVDVDAGRGHGTVYGTGRTSSTIDDTVRNWISASPRTASVS